jgi:cytochrome c-type biogenesis protein CcmH/NrfF
VKHRGRLALLAHQAHRKRRIARYQMLCRVTHSADRAFEFAMLSPFCPGKTLNSCPSPKAGEWRRDIREWVGEGVPEPEIRDRLQARVPGFDLSIPPVKSGWVIPVVAVVLSTWWFVVMARRFRRRSVAKPKVEAPTQDPALDTRLDEELALLD